MSGPIAFGATIAVIAAATIAGLCIIAICLFCWPLIDRAIDRIIESSYRFWARWLP